MEIGRDNKSKESLSGKCKLFFKRITVENDFFCNRIIFWLLILNFLASAADWIILAIFINRLDAGIILHYNVYFGVDAMGSWKKAFILPAISSSVFIVNAFLAGFFYKNKERIASHVLLLASLMVQLSFIVAATSVILINY